MSHVDVKYLFVYIYLKIRSGFRDELYINLKLKMTDEAYDYNNESRFGRYLRIVIIYRSARKLLKRYVFGEPSENYMAQRAQWLAA